jgi:hypothetical protein
VLVADPSDFRPEARADRTLSTIIVNKGELARVADAAEAALLANCPLVFHRAGQIVEVLIGGEKGRSDGVTRRKKSVIKAVSKYRLIDLLSVAARWEKPGLEGAGARIDPPDKIAEILLARGANTLRPLHGVIDAPILRADGSILEQDGYDESTGLYVHKAPELHALRIPSTPTREVAVRALEALKEPIASFPFVSGADQSAFLSGVLSAVMRPSLTTVPMTAFTAPAPGSGKSTLADLISVIATGERTAVVGQARDEAETEKRLVGRMIAGTPVINLDNCSWPVEGDFLCQLVTQPAVSVRPLGTSELKSLPTSATLLATGNSLVIGGDMTRRVLLVALDPGVERPEHRHFAFDPIVFAMEHRAKLVCAALTILRAFFVSKVGRQAPPLGSFEQWSDTVRSALLWLGEPDPCDVMKRARETDPKLQELREVLHSWYSVLRDEAVRTQDVIREASRQSMPGEFLNADLREAALAVAGAGGAINGRRLGRYLGASADRIVDGLRIVHRGLRGGSAVWAVEEVGPPI